MKKRISTSSAVFVPFPVCFCKQMTKKSRLDLHLLTKGLVKTRQEAQNIIRAGKVKTINGQILDKPGQEVLKDLAPKKYIFLTNHHLLESKKDIQLFYKLLYLLESQLLKF